MTLRHDFSAMGTAFAFVVESRSEANGRAAFAQAEERVHALERTLSRFLPGSELSRLNRDGQIQAGRDLRRLVRLALEARERTGGRFDPTVHDAVVAAGYDRTFDDLPADAPDDLVPRAGCGGRVELQGRVISLAPGARLDLGGIAKGYAADEACAILAAAGPCLVDAGGDIATAGRAWPVAVEHAGVTLAVEGGLATTGRDRRRWLRDGEERHHVIDPGTGRPARTGLLAATVAARTAAEAEVAATDVFLGGKTDAPRVLRWEDGRVELLGIAA